jgi:hypothetical protein
VHAGILAAAADPAPDEARRTRPRRRRREHPVLSFPEVLVHQLVQISGALLILSGFVLAQLGVLDPRSLWYLVVNLVGSAVLTVDAFREAQWGFVLLELV